MTVEPQKTPLPDPVTVPGATFTVTIPEVVQPAAVVYTIVVVPLDRLVNAPVALTVPTAVLLLLQVPPTGVLFNVAVEPTQMAAIPDIAAGLGLTVTDIAASEPQHPDDDCTLK
jgi:hypothetical protein